MSRFLGIVVVLILCGCGAPEAKVDAPAKPGEATKTYALTGEVREVDAEKGRVVIRHDEIPGYMPKMTMPFHVAKDALEDVHVDDKVSATLKVAGERFELEDFTVTEPAEPPALSLNLSGGEATLAPVPMVLEPGEEVPDFAMTTQDGKPLKLSDLRGKVVVLTFIFTRCPRPDFCPRIDGKFAELARKIGSSAARVDQVRLLSVSFDPEHDTPEVLAAHAKLRGAKPPLWEFAVSQHDELRKVAQRLGLMYGPTENEIIHSLSTAIIGSDGRLVLLETGSSWTPENVFTMVLKLLSR